MTVEDDIDQQQPNPPLLITKISTEVRMWAQNWNFFRILRREEEFLRGDQILATMCEQCVVPGVGEACGVNCAHKHAELDRIEETYGSLVLTPTRRLFERTAENHKRLVLLHGNKDDEEVESN